MKFSGIDFIWTQTYREIFKSALLSSNKLTNLLMPMSWQLFSNKRVLSCNFLATNNNFWCRQKLKMWISGALFEQKKCFFTIWHMSFFEQKVNAFIKILWKGQSSNCNFRIHKVWTRKTNFFTIHAKTTLNSQRTKNTLNTLYINC